LGKFKKSPAG